MLPRLAQWLKCHFTSGTWREKLCRNQTASRQYCCLHATHFSPTTSPALSSGGVIAGQVTTHFFYPVDRWYLGTFHFPPQSDRLSPQWTPFMNNSWVRDSLNPTDIKTEQAVSLVDKKMLQQAGHNSFPGLYKPVCFVKGLINNSCIRNVENKILFYLYIFVLKEQKAIQSRVNSGITGTHLERTMFGLLC